MDTLVDIENGGLEEAKSCKHPVIWGTNMYQSNFTPYQQTKIPVKNGGHGRKIRLPNSGQKAFRGKLLVLGRAQPAIWFSQENWASFSHVVSSSTYHACIKQHTSTWLLNTPFTKRNMIHGCPNANQQKTEHAHTHTGKRTAGTWKWWEPQKKPSPAKLTWNPKIGGL